MGDEQASMLHSNPWSGLLNLLEKRLSVFSPAPNTSSDKYNCITIQYLIYLLFVVLESIQEGESTIHKTDITDTENNVVGTKYSLHYEEDHMPISGTHQCLLLLNNVFGIQNMNVPVLTDAEYGIIAECIHEIKVDSPLYEIESWIEHWLSDNIDDEWNVYMELAEQGEFSVETLTHLQRIQKRISILGNKTFKNVKQHTPAVEEKVAAPVSAPPPHKRPSYIQKYTRKIRKHKAPLVN